MINHDIRILRISYHLFGYPGKTKTMDNDRFVLGCPQASIV